MAKRLITALGDPSLGGARPLRALPHLADCQWEFRVVNSPQARDSRRSYWRSSHFLSSGPRSPQRASRDTPLLLLFCTQCNAFCVPGGKVVVFTGLLNLFPVRAAAHGALV